MYWQKNECNRRTCRKWVGPAMRYCSRCGLLNADFDESELVQAGEFLERALEDCYAGHQRLGFSRPTLSSYGDGTHHCVYCGRRFSLDRKQGTLVFQDNLSFFVKKLHEYWIVERGPLDVLRWETEILLKVLRAAEVLYKGNLYFLRRKREGNPILFGPGGSEIIFLSEEAARACAASYQGTPLACDVVVLEPAQHSFRRCHLRKL